MNWEYSYAFGIRENIRRRGVNSSCFFSGHCPPLKKSRPQQEYLNGQPPKISFKYPFGYENRSSSPFFDR